MKEIGLIILTAITIFITVKFQEIKCETKAKTQNLESDFGIIKGCIVKYQGKWIDYERLRYTN